jgi:hypothetical protein
LVENPKIINLLDIPIDFWQNIPMKFIDILMDSIGDIIIQIIRGVSTAFVIWITWNYILIPSLIPATHPLTYIQAWTACVCLIYLGHDIIHPLPSEKKKKD